jgi:signal transduction histidine kinase
MPESEFIVLDKNGNLMVGKSIDKDYNPPQQAGVRKVETKKSVIYYEPIEIINGWVGLETPDIAIYRNLTYLIRLLIVFIVFSVAVALLLAIYFSKKVTGPVENLNMGARILGAGNLAYRIELKTGDEIQELADEFNLMAEKLKESYDSLGDKIRIATRDLQDAYSQIEDKNQQLKKADKLKSEFLASMSHELRTPINAIIGFSSLMEEGTYGKLTQRQEETLDKIIRNTNNLLNLINDILDLSKIEAGRMSLHTEKIKVNNLLKELSEELRPLAEAKGLDFKLDTGKGIKKEQLKHIFDEFVQADGSVTREFGGTGLGLSISKKLIDMMGGKIEIESKWEQGSSFKVFLPYETD